MPNVLVFCEFTGDQLKNGSLELLTLAKNSGNPVTALLIGDDCSLAAKKAAHYGAHKVIVSSDDSLKNYNSEVFSDLVSRAIIEASSNIVLASSTTLAKDLFPRVAARLNAGLASDCVSIDLQDEKLTVKKPLYSDKCTAEVTFQNSEQKIVLMRANQLPIGEPDSTASAETSSLAVESTNLSTIIKDIVKGTSETLDLTEANIIVAGGRGLRDKEGYKILEPLAKTLGATLGASRAIVDAEWVPHSYQVGQTGKTVAPSLYIACGISGAIQHLAGMTGSKVIVAINKDPEAPIFKKATYGIVGDVFEVVPKLTEEFKNLL